MVVDHREYHQDGGSDSRVLDGVGGGAETALPDKLPDDTNAAGLSKKGLEMSVG